MWHPIETAPKDGSIVRLRDKNGRYVNVLAWDKKLGLWVGEDYSPCVASRTYWDESFCPIHEWQHLNEN